MFEEKFTIKTHRIGTQIHRYTDVFGTRYTSKKNDSMLGND
jgi:hypothetical protein